MKVKVKRENGFLFLVDENDKVIGTQKDLSILQSVENKGNCIVSVDFVVDLDDISL